MARVRQILIQKGLAIGAGCLFLLLSSCGGDSPAKPVETRALKVVVTGNGEGRVVSTPAGIDCATGTCTGQFPVGAKVLLTAATNGAHTFTGWSGGCTGTEQCVLTVNDTLSVGAMFARPRVAKIDITPVSANLAIGDSIQLVAVARDAAGAVVTGRPITWTSFNTSFVTVSSSGMVTAVDGGGAANVVAAIAPDVAGGSTIATVLVTVIPPEVTVTATDSISREIDQKPGVFTVTRSGNTNRPLTVTMRMSGTALNDYVLDTFSPTIPAGARSTTLKVLPYYDTLLEGTETAIASFAASTRYTGTNTATVFIEDAGIGPELVPGVTFTDSITTPGEARIYHFASRFDFGYIAISVADTSNASLVPDIRLMAPSNYVLGHAVGPNVAQIFGGISFGGTHGVIVTSGDSAHTGTGRFTITFAQAAADSVPVVAPGDEGGLLELDKPRTGVLYKGDLDTYTFTLPTTGKTIVQMDKLATPGSTLMPKFHIIGPRGDRVIVTTDPTSAVYNTIMSAGQYTIVLTSGDALGEGAGGYTLRVTQPPQ